MNENESYVFSVEQPVKWSMPPEQFWITGWFVSKNGIRYVDVRAFIDDVPFMGLLGLPRTDIESTYPQWTAGQHPGFAFRLDPWPGAKLIRLEILNENNDWAEFWRVPIRVKGKGPGRRLHPTLNPDLVKSMLLELLKQPSFRPGVTREAHVRKLVRERSVIPLETLPVPPLYGVFEGPHVNAHTQYDKLHIGGWIFHADQPIRRLIATTDNLTQNNLIHGLERADVGALFPGQPRALTAQFRGNVDLPGHLAEPVCLKVFAILESGEKVLGFTKRLYPWTSLEKEHPLPPYSFANYRDLIRCILKVCRALKVNTGGIAFWRQVLAVHALYRDESQDPLPWFDWQSRRDYPSWLAHNSLAPRLRDVLVKSAAALAQPSGPSFAIVVDTRAASSVHLGRLLDSLRNQLFTRWQVALLQTHDASPEIAAELSRLASTDSRIRVVVAPDANHTAALNAAAHSISDDWLIFPDASGRLAVTALLFIAEAIERSPGTELIFTDEDRMDDGGQRTDPQFKCGFNPALFLSGQQPGHLFVLHRKLYMRAREFMPDYAPAYVFDLALRVAENVTPDRVQHVDAICYHAAVGSSRVDLQACKLEYSIVSPK